MGSIIHVGIDFVTRNLGQAVQGVRQFAGAFSEAHKQATIFANGMQANERKVQRSVDQMRRALSVDWRKKFEEQKRFYMDNMNKAIESITHMFDNAWRNIANRFNSIVMGSVALSMSGIGIRNIGQNIARFMGMATEQATNFELAMKQVAYYGGVAGDELKRLRDQALRLGREMPVSPSEVAAATVTAMKTGYQDVEDALKMAEQASILQFLSFGGLDGNAAMKFLNFAKQLTGTRMSDVEALTDMLTKTVDVSALELEGLFRAMMSSRSAAMNLNLDAPQLLALLGGMGNVLNERGAGESLNVFSRGFLQALGAEVGTKRGDLFRQLGIDLDQDILSILDQIVTRSMELWPDHFERMEKRMDIFGNDAGTLLNAYEANLRNGELTLKEMERQIREAAGTGYAQKTLDVFMDSLWGVQERLRSVREEFQILFGLAFAPGLNMILEQLTKILERVNTFLDTHPKFAKFAGYILGIGSALAIVTGTLMIFGGMVVGVYASVMAFTANLVRSTQVLGLLNRGARTAGEMLKKQFLTPVQRVTGALARMTAASTLLYLAWRYDFLGMRTTLSRFWTHFNSSMNKARGMVERFRSGTLEEFTLSLNQLGEGTLARKLTNFLIFMEALGELWSDNAISEDQFLKLQETGLLPTLEMIMDMKFALSEMWEGFITGAKNGLEILKPLLEPLWRWVKRLYDTFVNIGVELGFLDYESDGVSSKWRSIAETVGGLVGAMVALRIATKAWAVTIGLPLRLLRGMNRMFKWFGGWWGGGGPGRMAKSAGRGVGRTLLWPFGLNYDKTKAYGKTFGETLSNRVKRSRWFSRRYQGASSVPYVDPRRVPDDYYTNPQRYPYFEQMLWNSQHYGGRQLVRGKDGRIYTRAQNWRGRIGDLFLGRREFVQRDAQGRLYRMDTSAGGKQVKRFLTNAEAAQFNRRGSLRAGGLVGRLGRFGGAILDALPFLGRIGGSGVGRAAAGATKFAGTIGKGLLKGLGKVIIKGLPFIFKLGLRAIPFLGWALMAWDAIRLIWSNWDWFKSAGQKIWDWMKNIGSTVWDFVKEKALNVVTSIGDFFKSMIDRIKNYFSELWDNVRQSAAKKLSNLEDKVVQAVVGNDPAKKAAAKVGIRTGLAISTGQRWLMQPPVIPESHSGSKVVKGGLVNLAPGEVVLRDKTVKEFEALVRAQRHAASASRSEPVNAAPQMNITFDKGAILIQVANASQAEIEKAAEKLFRAFMKKVETQNMQHYRLSRG